MKSYRWIHGESILHWLALGNHVDYLKVMLEYGSFIDESNAFGCSALFYACQVKNHETIRFLLENGAFPYVESTYSNTNVLDLVKDEPDLLNLLIRYNRISQKIEEEYVLQESDKLNRTDLLGNSIINTIYILLDCFESEWRTQEIKEKGGNTDLGAWGKVDFPKDIIQDLLFVHSQIVKKIMEFKELSDNDLPIFISPTLPIHQKRQELQLLENDEYLQNIEQDGSINNPFNEKYLPEYSGNDSIYIYINWTNKNEDISESYYIYSINPEISIREFLTFISSIVGVKARNIKIDTSEIGEVSDDILSLKLSQLESETLDLYHSSSK
jgi:hypothetical protein